MSREYDPNFVSEKVLTIVGQKIVIENKERKILVLQRSEKSGAGGQWSFPGGGIERGEDPIESIKREVDEETRLVLSEIKTIGAFSYLNEEDFVVILVYTGKIMSEKVELNWEHDDFRWVNVEEAEAMNLTRDARKILKKYQD